MWSTELTSLRRQRDYARRILVKERLGQKQSSKVFYPIAQPAFAMTSLVPVTPLLPQLIAKSEFYGEYPFPFAPSTACNTGDDSSREQIWIKPDPLDEQNEVVTAENNDKADSNLLVNSNIIEVLTISLVEFEIDYLVEVEIEF